MQYGSDTPTGNERPESRPIADLELLDDVVQMNLDGALGNLQPAIVCFTRRTLQRSDADPRQEGKSQRLIVTHWPLIRTMRPPTSRIVDRAIPNGI